MTEMTERPLVSFAVIAYNQERFIREAVEGAFAQTYQPLEIILSDDCSPDGTFAIMQEMAAAYDGPHKVVLNRNEPNLGIVPHIDRMMEIVSGEFIVVNAGDDVSYPERTAVLVDTWVRSRGKCLLIHSSAHLISEEGVFVKEVSCAPIVKDDPSPKTFSICGQWVRGATAAWDRRLFIDFGPIGEGVSTEDHILPFRASTLGGVSFVEKPLIKYRTNGISGGFINRSGADFLYGNSLRGRKWQAEVDRYIADMNLDYDYPDKDRIRDFCNRRAPQLEFSVCLARLSYFGRFCTFPKSICLSAQLRSFTPVKDWLRYTFDRPYMIYADWRITRRQKQKAAVSQDARDV